MSLRAHIGDLMPQEEDIFRGTLMENISMGHKDVTLQDVIFAVEKAGLGNFVKRLPDGYDTVLLPAGKNLPQSVISKIILARCFASRPAMIAVEEPFAQLEPEERKRLAEILTNPANNCTLLAVSNDSLLASRCDRVVIMQEGRIVEEGSFEKIRKGKHFMNVFKN